MRWCSIQATFFLIKTSDHGHRAWAPSEVFKRGIPPASPPISGLRKIQPRGGGGRFSNLSLSIPAPTGFGPFYAIFCCIFVAFTVCFVYLPKFRNEAANTKRKGRGARPPHPAQVRDDTGLDYRGDREETAVQFGNYWHVRFFTVFSTSYIQDFQFYVL